MAYMITDGKPSITTINKFLGLNLNETGETQLQLGEASDIRNFRITKDFKLDKMYGYSQLYSLDNYPIRAIWAGELRGNDILVYVCNGKVYKDGTQIGTMTDDITSIYEFSGLLYFINGHDFKYYNGTTFGDVGGYQPTIKISCTPAGVGVDYEAINLISDFRKVSFSADGTSTVYQLPEKDITCYANDVWINGTSTNSWQYNSANGTLTFTSAPAQGTDNVVIRYKKNNVDSSLKENITKNKYCQKFGLSNDTRVFLYGNESAKNRIYFSDYRENKAEYFPATNFLDIGSSNSAITDIQRQYDRLIVFKDTEAYYMSYDSIKDPEGNSIITFPVYPLNAVHGMIAPNQGQVLDNYVTSIDRAGIIQWVSTNTKDERNAVVISERISRWLNSKDMTEAVTLDYQEDKEFWIAVGQEVMIYNYGNSTFYMLKLPVEVAKLVSYKGTIYMGTTLGILAKFDKNYNTFNGSAIDAQWASGQYDFNVEYRRKTMRILWITLKPYWKTSLRINYVSDRDLGYDEKEIVSNCFNYNDWDYADFSYNTINPIKPFKVKLKAKKFAFLKLIISNSKLEDRLTVDSISIQKAYGGYVK